ncbi:PLP-dependent aminotransferase family protein [Nocardia sp. CNY236]|uniref:MocR-like pyridoxine biosynthesis transcription factor PdxR n=1 Tax=Nocardia sp. CNY236 TaxID=1169152 RepID=UPI000419B6A7|nr:PLP-dependent aminotransferase family protein [Nocardia sp. CNY236]
MKSESTCEGVELDDLPFVLDRDGSTLLSVQIADQLRQAATGGLLRTGDRLPSTRGLARRLGVSRTVVAVAYDQLHAEGWIEGHQGSGTYLTTAPAATPVHGAVLPGADSAPHLFDLAPGAPCTQAIDPAAWRRAWRAAADHSPLVRKHRAGEPEFRQAVLHHLLRHRGIGTDTGAVLLATAGASSAVGELAVAALRPGDVVAMEDPGYQRAAGAFEAAGVEVLPVPVDENGLRVDCLPTGIHAVYCTPAHQFPLGARLPAVRRVALIEHARRCGILVIEDDYDGELRYDTAPLPLLATMAPDVVVHLGTTSKILSPSLGIGWLLAPPDIAEAVLALRERTGTGPSPAGQRVLVALADHGDLARHLRRLRRRLPPRRALVVAQLRRHGLGVVGDDAGSHVVALLDSAETEQRVIANGQKRGVALDGLARHHRHDVRDHFGVALGYAALPWSDLVAAVPIAAECLADF